MSIKGTTHQTKTPPAKTKSTVFMDNSMASIEINDIPKAVFNASGNVI